MADLISRKAAIEAFTGKPPEYYHTSYIVGELNCLPAVDAVPVILCRNCKYGEPETNGFGEDMVMCQNKQNPIGYEDWLMPPEFYCADGEWRE